MIRELGVQEAREIIGGRDEEPAVIFPDGGWVINCTSSGNSYARILSGTGVTASGSVTSGGITPVSAGYYANQEYRAGERNLDYTPVTVSYGC